MLQSRTEEAIRELQAALQNNPNFAIAHYAWEWSTNNRDAPMRRSVNFRKRYGSTPTMPTCDCELGRVYAHQGQVDEAIPEFQAALRINPDDADSAL